MGKLRALEQEEAANKSALPNQRLDEMELTGDQIRRHEGSTLLTLRQKLTDIDGPNARAAFQRHLPGLVCTPTERDGKRMYRVPGKIQMGEQRESAVVLVAGACYTAIHNALGVLLVRSWSLPKNGRRPCHATTGVLR